MAVTLLRRKRPAGADPVRPCPLGARALGVDPADRVVVEDAPAGLRAGRAAGTATVALTTTHRAGELGVHLVVDHLAARSALVTGGGVEITARD
ncbi:hypothetical protein [Streptomyces ziwulingensis]|uniref:Phosphatase n=1 Tax=Streptomyces ziwulingensis TaxID=1045501 RepID=A0ABP9BD10_9ACTN